MKNKKFSSKNIFANLFVYGFAHALVDAVCAGVIFSILKNKIVGIDIFAVFILLYSVLAFGLQALFGLLFDYLKSPRDAAVWGCILVGTSSFVFLSHPVFAIVCAGIGNALFHVGGGSISLNLTPQKASAPGVFVAPGAFGLFLGTVLGKSGQFVAWPFVCLLFVFCIFMFIVKKPKMNYVREDLNSASYNYFEIIFLLIFLSIAIRSLVGSLLVFPWKIDFVWLSLLTAAVVLGKGLGGVLADKFGWLRVGVGSLAASIPFLVFATHTPYLAIIGMFLFNVTMPITLVALSNILPGRPGFAFGLTCFALILGALPSFFEVKNILSGKGIIFAIICISALSLYFGLQFYFKDFIKKST